jgi:hypothetical protein
MPRPWSATMLAQLSAQKIRPVLFLQMHFNDGDIFVWSGIGNVTWNSQIWTGLGQLGTISSIEESSELKATNVTFTLSGIPQDLIQHALGQVRQGNAVKLWFGCLGDNNNVMADPLQIFAGRMDVPTIDEGAQTSTISISVENRLIDLNRSRERRYTNQDQQIDHPGDLGFQYVQFIQNWNGTWGKAGPGGIPLPHIGGGGGGGGRFTDHGQGGGTGDGFLHHPPRGNTE